MNESTRVFGVGLVFFLGLYALAVFLIIGLPIFIYMELQ